MLFCFRLIFVCVVVVVFSKFFDFVRLDGRVCVFVMRKCVRSWLEVGMLLEKIFIVWGWFFSLSVVLFELIIILWWVCFEKFVGVLVKVRNVVILVFLVSFVNVSFVVFSVMGGVVDSCYSVVEFVVFVCIVIMLLESVLEFVLKFVVFVGDLDVWMMYILFFVVVVWFLIRMWFFVVRIILLIVLLFLKFVVSVFVFVVVMWIGILMLVVKNVKLVVVLLIWVVCLEVFV